MDNVEYVPVIVGAGAALLTALLVALVKVEVPTVAVTAKAYE
jgi:hypothetical protein